jgi:hypothetical protein
MTDLTEVMTPVNRQRKSTESAGFVDADMLSPLSAESVEQWASRPLSLRPLTELSGLVRVAINPVAMHQLHDWIHEEVPDSWMPLLIEDCDREFRFEGIVREAARKQSGSASEIESPTSMSPEVSEVDSSLLLRGVPLKSGGIAAAAAMSALVPIVGGFLGSLLSALASAAASGSATRTTSSGRLGPIAFSLAPGADQRVTSSEAPVQVDTKLTVDIRHGRVDKTYFAAVLLGGIGYVVPGCALSVRLLRPTGELIVSADEFIADEEDQPIELRWNAEGGARGVRVQDRLELSFRHPESSGCRFKVTLVLQDSV